MSFFGLARSMSKDEEDNFILLTHGDRTQLARRPEDYASAQRLAKRMFGLPADALVRLAIDWKGRKAEIGKDAFDVINRADELFVLVTANHAPADCAEPRDSGFQVFVKTLSKSYLVIA
jgi:hypothetical protein